MILFRKTLKTSIVIIFSLITLWITLASCEHYCDDKVGIYLYAYKYNSSLDLANTKCKKTGSILLEIYDDKYKEVTINAIKKFRLENQWLLFGLLYINGHFQWLSNRKVPIFPFQELYGFKRNTNCNFYLKLYKSQLRVDPACGRRTPQAYFMCLKDNNRSTTLRTTKRLTTKTFIKPNTSPTNFNNNNQSFDLQINTAGVSVGVVLIIIIVIVVGVVLWKYQKQKSGNNTSEGHELKDKNSDAPMNYKATENHGEQVNNAFKNEDE